MRPRVTHIAAACCAFLIVCARLPAQNPVATALQSAALEAGRNLVESAEEMPADKYGFKPTPAQMSFAQVVLHVAGGNAMMCGWIAGTKAPEQAKLSPDDAKEKLVARLKDSFTFCTSALAQVDDSKLGDSIPSPGRRKVTRAAEMVDLAVDWADHYSQLAIYLRLNGLLPPTAKRKGM